MLKKKSRSRSIAQRKFRRRLMYERLEGRLLLCGNDIHGDSGNNHLEGTSGGDSIFAGAGADFASGLGGRDCIHGQDGPDELHGGDGNDDVFGGNGADQLWGGPGVDRLEGGPGDDMLFGGQDGDTLHGGKGDDALQGHAGADCLRSGFGTLDTLDGGDGDDRLVAGSEGAMGCDVNSNGYTTGVRGNVIAFGGLGQDIFEPDKYQQTADRTFTLSDFQQDEDKIDLSSYADTIKHLEDVHALLVAGTSNQFKLPDNTIVVLPKGVSGVADVAVLDLRPQDFDPRLDRRPDLSGLSFNAEQTVIAPGELLDLLFKIQNTGESDAIGEFRVDVMISQDDNVIDSDDYKVGEAFVDGLGKGMETPFIELNPQLPGENDPFWQQNGQFRIGLLVDSTDVISESDEQNNANSGFGVDYDTVEILPPPELRVNVGNGVVVTEDGQTVDSFFVVVPEPRAGQVTVGLRLATEDFGRIEFSQDGGNTYNEIAGITFGPTSFGFPIWVRGRENATVDEDPTVHPIVEVVASTDTNYPVGMTTTVPVTIQDNDSLITLSISTTSVEEDSSATLIVDLDRSGGVGPAITVPFTVEGAADLGDDYTQSGAETFTATSGTVEFAAGETSAQIMIDPIADSVFEADENIKLTFSTGGSAFFQIDDPDHVEATIENDDNDNTPPTPPGGVAVRQLSGAIVEAGGVRDLRLVPDGDLVVYVADENGDGNEQVYVAPIVGGSVTQISHFSGGMDIHDIRVTSDGEYAVFQADLADVVDLYSVPLDGSGGAVRLNEALAPGEALVWSPLSGTGQDVQAFEVSPDGSRVVFVADAEVDGQVDLYSVPVNGGAQTRLSGELETNGNVDYNWTNPSHTNHPFVITPDSQRVVFRADALAENRQDVFSVPIDGGSRTHVNSGVVASVLFYEVTLDSSLVVFLTNGSLYSAPTTGGAPVTLSSQAGGARFELSPDGSTALFHEIVNGERSIAAVSVTGGNLRSLTGSLPNFDGAVELAEHVFSDGGSHFSDDGALAAFRDNLFDDGRGRLHVATVDSNEVLTVDVGPVKGGEYFDAAFPGTSFTPDGQYVLHATLEFSNGPALDQSLYASPISGAPPILLQRFSGNDLGLSFGFNRVVRSLPDSSGVIYSANVDGSRDLYSVPLTGEVGVRLTTGASIGDNLGGWSPSSYFGKSWVLSPNGERVVYIGTDGVSNLRRLFSVASDDPFFDFGDLPDSYGTRLSSDGARHEITGLRLGEHQDAESTGSPSFDASGDDNSGTPGDEEGVEFNSLHVGQSDASLTADVSGAEGGAKLYAWMDFDHDGQFGGGEQIVAGLDVINGLNPFAFSIPDDAVEGTTYVRVRLSSDVGVGSKGPASDGEVEDYQVEIQPRQGLDPPVIIEPVGSIVDRTPTFRWEAVAGATSYELWVYYVNSDTHQIVHETGLTETSFTPDEDLPLGDYRMWVRAYGPDSLISPWSQTGYFTIGPQLVAPTLVAPDGPGGESTPNFVWNGVAGATSYQLLVYNVTTNVQGIVDRTVPAATSYQTLPSEALPAARYRFWVRGIDAGDTPGPWSAPQDFQVGTVPDAPTLIGPQGNTFDTTPTFSWNAVANAAKYELTVYNKTTDTHNVIHETDLTTTSFTPTTALAIGQYQFWVRAQSADGLWGQWGVPCYFTIGAPGVPVLIGPTGNTNDTTPTFSWNAATGAARYEISVYDATTNTHQVIHDTSITGTSYTSGIALTVGHHYSFWVRAFNADDLAGEWSDLLQFTVIA